MNKNLLTNTYIYITGGRKTLRYDSKFHAIDAIIRYSNDSTWF